MVCPLLLLLLLLLAERPRRHSVRVGAAPQHGRNRRQKEKGHSRLGSSRGKPLDCSAIGRSVLVDCARRVGSYRLVLVIVVDAVVAN